MKKRTFISIFLSSMIGATLINPVFANSSTRAPVAGKSHLLTKTLQRQAHRPSRGGSTLGAHPQGHQRLVHDSDEQLDIWVSRCNKAGGGMILDSDGDYDCVKPSGESIPNW